MKIFAGIAVLTVGWLVASAEPASAAWNNVFQPTCNSCRSNTSYYAPPSTGGCPTISYRQRSYYQSYTAYRMESYYEPITRYRRSFYWEPVTRYSYTTYYDPCSGCPQQVCTPHTSYRLRSQCNAVQSYVQRCHMVPYTAYRQSCYYEPVVTYSAPACPSACPSACPTCPTASPSVSEPPSTLPPQNIPDPNRKALPNVSEENNIPRQNLPNTRNKQTQPNIAGAPVRMDRIASYRNGRIQGTVVADDRITPLGGTQIFFASVQRKGEQIAAQADPTGRFQVELPAGEWNLYTTGANGKAVYHSQISVHNNDQRLVTLVTR